jgi:hypothetical protein
MRYQRVVISHMVRKRKKRVASDLWCWWLVRLVRFAGVTRCPITGFLLIALRALHRHPAVTDLPLQCKSLQASMTRSVIDASAFLR